MSEDNANKFDLVKEFVTLRDNLTRSVGEGLRTITANTAGFPAVDIYLDGEHLVIRTEPLLGIQPTSIEVGMENEALVISGETKDNTEVDASAFLSRELRFGPFSRNLRLPRKVNAHEAKASLKNDVLTIRLPLVADSEAQIIDVKPVEE